MKINALTFLMVCLSNVFAFGQMTIKDSFEELIPAKIKYNASIGVAERWKVQTFSGTLDASKTAYIDFRKTYRAIDATIVFAQPHYKVWAVNSRTRFECERIMEEIKKNHPNLFLVKPKL